MRIGVVRARASRAPFAHFRLHWRGLVNASKAARQCTLRAQASAVRPQDQDSLAALEPPPRARHDVAESTEDAKPSLLLLRAALKR
jgi:hypothetical protein